METCNIRDGPGRRAVRWEDMDKFLQYAMSSSITDLGEDVVQYIEFDAEAFLRQVNEITSDCPYTGYSRIGTLINNAMDQNIKIIGHPSDYPSLLRNKVASNRFEEKWEMSNEVQNMQKYLTQQKNVDLELAKIADLRNGFR